MDLNSMLNDNVQAPQKRTSSQASTPDGGRFMGHQQLPTPSANGIPVDGGHPSSYQASHTPLYGPSSLTPLMTPSQAQAGNQYPFPTQPLTRPSSEAHPVTSPVGTRTNLPYPHMSPSNFGPGVQNPTLHAAHSTSSHSPTPSSHPSHTPHSVRQSPLAFSQPLGQMSVPQQQHYISQPSTPLGPPPPVHRMSNPIDRTTPVHQRTLSGASSGKIAGSPAQHRPSIGNLVESPNAQQRSPDRGRSASVSPKTMVPPRLASMGSRHSSQSDVHSARESLQPSGSITLPVGTPTAGDPSYPHPHATQMVNSSSHSDMLSSQQDNRPPVEYHSHKLGMNHLLSPSTDSPDPSRQSPNSRRSLEPSRIANLRSSGPMGQPVSAAPPAAQSHTITEENSRSPSILKRSAEDQAGSEPPAKRFRKRRYQEPPIWATRHPQSLRTGYQPIPQSHASHQHHQHQQQQQQQHPQNQQQQQQHQHRPSPRQQVAEPRERLAEQPQQQQQQRRHTPPLTPENGDPGALIPWQQDPPLNIDLMRMRRALGQWENTMNWHAPTPRIVAIVQDWLSIELDKYRDVGDDPLEGSIEIEAKIGTLINQSDGMRCNLPVCGHTIIHPNFNRSYRFESQMNMEEHRKMNEHLNAVTRMSTDKGRVPIHYEHLRENDSFRTLSVAGLNELPVAARNRPMGRELKLRTTTKDGSRNVKARIVKLPLANLHIFSPEDPYDCRISINLEVNMDRPGIDLDALTVDPSLDRTAPDRHKDRMTYHHLAYTVDLTRVDVKGAAPKFELELELDARLLRRSKAHDMHTYSNVVKGFLDNCSLLMSHR